MNRTWASTSTVIGGARPQHPNSLQSKRTDARRLRELAGGLALSGKNFMWVIRHAGAGSDAATDAQPGWKPDGVAELMAPPGGRGFIIRGWAPQTLILSHPAVGAVLTHCGWGSVVEGLQFGHPLIMLPLAGDQGPNARLMEGRKVGMQVPRNESDGSFTREDVAATVQAVAMEEDGSRVFTANAKTMQEIVADSACHER